MVNVDIEDQLKAWAREAGDLVPPVDAGDAIERAGVLAGAAGLARSASVRRSLPVAAAVLAVVALAVGAIALAGADDDATTVAGPDVSSEGIEGVWRLAATIRDGDRTAARNRALIAVDETRLIGDDGCGNPLDKPIVDGRVIEDGGERTDAPCPDIQANEEADFLLDVLRREPVAQTRDDELWFLTDAGDGVVFARYVSDGDLNSDGGVDGPVMYAPRSQAGMREQLPIAGHLIRDGDCLYVESDAAGTSAQRHSLIWPFASTWDDHRTGVWVLGGLMVPVGGTFSTTGGYYAVESLHDVEQHPAVVERARLCDNGLEIAYVQGEVAVPVTQDPSVSVALDGIGQAVAAASPLAASEQGWFEHTVTFENTGTEPLHLQDFRSGTMLGDGEVAVATDGCGYGSSTGQPVAMGCRRDYRPVTIEPGGAHTFTVTLWRDLAGMTPVGDGPHQWRIPVEHGDTPFDDPNQTGATATVTLTYENLSEPEGSESPGS